MHRHDTQIEFYLKSRYFVLNLQLSSHVEEFNPKEKKEWFLTRNIACTNFILK